MIKKGKPFPYLVKNHRLSTKLVEINEIWACTNYFMIKNEVISNISDPVTYRKTLEMALVTPELGLRALDKHLSVSDLMPVLKQELVGESRIAQLNGVVVPGDGDINKSGWLFTSLLPPDDINYATVLDVRYLRAYIVLDGFSVWCASPILLGWVLYRFQDFDSNLVWEISPSTCALYLKKNNDIKAVLALMSFTR